MCMKTAIEEKVDATNIEKLKEMIINGAEVYPGALDICLDGDSYNLNDNNWVDLSESSPNERGKDTQMV